MFLNIAQYLLYTQYFVAVISKVNSILFTRIEALSV